MGQVGTRQSRRARLAVALPAAVAAICLAVAMNDVALGAKGDSKLVSRQSVADGGAGAGSWSYGGSISDNGRFVAFRSEAKNLDIYNPDPYETTIYVQDLKLGVVETVSRQSNLGAAADGSAYAEQISGNGRFVAFTTDAENLGGPIQADYNVYVYDRKNNRVELISRKSKSRGGAGANENSGEPSISADGRYVAFESRATNLGRPKPNGNEAQIFVRDRKLKRTFIVSLRSNGKLGKSDSFDPSIAGRAPIVAFASSSSNMGGPVHEDSIYNVFAHNWKTGKTALVSRRSGDGKGARGESGTPEITANGRQVAFATNAKNLGGPFGGVTDDFNRIYVHDLKTGKTTLVSRQSKSDGGRSADAYSGGIGISNDGRYVAFGTSATNLGGPIQQLSNVYVYDRKQKRVILASRAPGGGVGADDDAYGPSIAGSSPFVTFETPAMNIDPPGEPAYHGNFPPATNVYRFQFAG